MPETQADDAHKVAERLREAIEAHPFIINSLGSVLETHLTISGGLAAFPLDSGTKEGLIVAADVALLRAKYTSRNRICRFADEPGRLSFRLDPAEVHEALQTASIAAVESLAQALDARDSYTKGHSDSVTRIALARIIHEY
jgi:predicted signal transduction protein with EAL and GGDEF domain